MNFYFNLKVILTSRHFFHLLLVFMSPIDEGRVPCAFSKISWAGTTAVETTAVASTTVVSMEVIGMIGIATMSSNITAMEMVVGLTMGA